MHTPVTMIDLERHKQEDTYFYWSIAWFIFRALDILDLIISKAQRYTISFISINNFNNLHESYFWWTTIQLEIRQTNIKNKKSWIQVKYTSREAKRETTPMGMKTMLTSIKAEITCQNTQIETNSTGKRGRESINQVPRYVYSTTTYISSIQEDLNKILPILV